MILHGTAKLIFAVIGGDNRQVRLCQLLLRCGHVVRTFALDRGVMGEGITTCGSAQEACRGAVCVILPIPLEGESGILNTPLSNMSIQTTEVMGEIERGTIALSGGLKPDILSLAKEKGIKLTDILKREDFAISNATITAEGAIQIAMEELDRVIAGIKCLVIGNGKLGKSLAYKFKALNAETYVSARKASDFSQIRSMGHIPLKTSKLDREIAAFDLIINTVPSLTLSRSQLRFVKEGALIIDLASKPGGVDFAAAEELGIRTKWALSLPGKVAPLSSAEIVKETVMSVLEEEGVL